MVTLQETGDINKENVKTAASNFYKTSKEYLEQWCQFNEELKKFEWANLRKVPSWEDVQKVMDLLIEQKFISSSQDTGVQIIDCNVKVTNPLCGSSVIGVRRMSKSVPVPAANIPLNKVSNQSFRKFLEIYTGNNVPTETNLRLGYIDDIFDETMSKIKLKLSGKKGWVSIDESTDIEGRFIGILEANYK
ncbi:hypothetical protein QTP88_015662 [Uroleucon formosanum]